MDLDARARAVGRKVAEQTWIVALRNLVCEAPWGLRDVEVEVGPDHQMVLTVPPELLRETRAEWWRELEAQVDVLLASCSAQEAELVTRILERLPSNPRKPGVLRRLGERVRAAEAPARSPRRRAGDG